MSTAMASEDQEWAQLLHTWEKLDVPKRWRAEIFEGAIKMTLPPAMPHGEIDAYVNRALVRALGDEWLVCHEIGHSIPHIRRLYVPDIAVLAAADVAEHRTSSQLPAELARLVVEIVSPSNARIDRVEKLWGYGQAGVPLYLLVDRFDVDGPSVTLYSDPADGHFREIRKVPFGKPVELPEPIGLTLETSDFSRR